MAALAPLVTLYDESAGEALPLPAPLAALYGGPLRLSRHPAQPRVLANFVTTLDGVVALDDPDHTGGGEISGWNVHDRMVMGLLRAVAGAVVVGARTMAADPRALWTAEHIYPPLAREYQELRAALGETQPPLQVFVTARGVLPREHPALRAGAAPVLIVTTEAGAAQLRAAALPSAVEIAAVQPAGAIPARTVLAAIQQRRASAVVLVEGGPHLLGDMLAERQVDELFLTLAPQIAGRADDHARLGLVAGRTFAPQRPLWSTLASVKLAGSHLLLRYALQRSQK